MSFEPKPPVLLELDSHSCPAVVRASVCRAVAVGVLVLILLVPSAWGAVYFADDFKAGLGQWQPGSGGVITNDPTYGSVLTFNRLASGGDIFSKVTVPAGAYLSFDYMGFGGFIGTAGDWLAGQQGYGGLEQGLIYDNTWRHYEVQVRNAGQIMAEDYVGTAGQQSPCYFGNIVVADSQAPLIVSPPANATNSIGAMATFSSFAAGAPPLAYEWTFNGTNLTDNGNIIGSRSNLLTLSNLLFAEAGSYSVVVSNAYGAVTSAPAYLFVTDTDCATPPAGLVSWWPGDGNANDIVGGNNGVLENGVAFVQGEVGSAFSFTKGLDYMQVPDNNVFDFGSSQDFTAECWVRLQTPLANDEDDILGKRDVGVGNGWYMRLLGAHLVDAGIIVQSNGFGIQSTGPVPTNVWTHLALERMSDQMLLFVNGTLAGQVQATNASLSNAAPFVIGAAYDSAFNPPIQTTGNFVGQIDEVSLYNRALSVGEIQSIYAAGSAGKCALPPVIVVQPANKTNLVGTTASFSVTASGAVPLSYQWQFNGTNLTDGGNVIGSTSTTLTLSNVLFNETGSYEVVVSNAYGEVTSAPAYLLVTNMGCATPPSGLVSWWPGDGNANDIQGTNNGTLVNGATFAAGVVGSAFSFGGADDYVEIPSSPNLNPGTAITLEAWLFADGTPAAQQGIAGTWDDVSGNNRTYLLWLQNGAMEFLISPDGGAYGRAVDSTAFPLNRWVHVVATYDGSNIRIYRDGTQVGTVPQAGPIASNNRPFFIGRTDSGSSGSHFWKGRIDEFSLYDRALSSNEIAAIYAAGSAGKCKPAVSPNLVIDGGFENAPSLSPWWSVQGFSGGYPRVDAYPPYAHTGSNYADLAGSGLNSISQALTTTPGAYYIIQVWAVEQVSNASDFQISFGGAKIDEGFPGYAPTGQPYTLYQSTQLATNASTVLSLIGNGGAPIHVDDVSVTLLEATPTITWTNPAAISYGTPLSSNQLNATANLPGTFAYTPTNGTVLNAGTNTLSVIFTPNDTVDYSSVAASVSLVVTPAFLTVTAENTNRVYGVANPAFSGTVSGLLNGDNITANFVCPAVSISPPGSYPITPALNDPNSRLGNYVVTTNAGTLTVTAGPPPTLVNVTPGSGLTNGNTPVTITGTGFELGAYVSFAGQPATSVNVSSGTELTAVTPSGPLGQVNVVLTNPDQTTATLSNGFTYTGPPDLAPVAVALPGSVISGGFVEVSCLVTNEGTGSASGYWYDTIYFNSNAIPNPTNATLLGYVYQNHNMSAGGSYAWTNRVTVPQVPVGAYYLFVVVDDPALGNVVYEATKTNNTSAADTLEVTSPDLSVGGIMGPASAVIAQPVQLIFTTTNGGNADAVGPWQNQILLSNNTNGVSAQLLGTFTFTNIVGAGDSTTSTQTVILPASVFGTQYFGVFVDSANAIPDSNRSNNLAFTALPTVITGPDLDMARLSSTGSAQFGQNFTVTFAVTNVGGAPATAAWNDQIYLSSPANSLSGASLLATLPGSSPLAAGSGYTRTQTVTVPLTTASTPGNFYLIAVADTADAQFELTKTNNQLATPIAITLPPLPDLVAGQLTSPTSVVSGQSVAVSWAVTNIGATNAIGPWQETVYLVPASLTLSQFNTNLSAYPLIGAFIYTNNLAPGASITRTQQVTIPLIGLAGDLQVAVYVDAANNVLEQDETNNAALALNEMEVPTALSLYLSITNVLENTSTPNLPCLLSRNGDLSAPLVVAVASSATNHLLVPSTITIPAGIATAPFAATVLDDGIPDSNALVTISASANGYQSATSQFTVVNTDVPTLSLSLAPSVITEGQNAVATVMSTTVSNQQVTISLSTSSPSALAAPATVSIPPNSNSVTFTLSAVQSTILAPPQVHTVTASASGYASASLSVTVLNDNTPALTLSLDRTNINEADGAFAAFGTITRQPVNDQALTVALVSTNPGAAVVPAHVTIPALLGNATFHVAAVDSTNIAGPKVTLISAQALDIQGDPVGNSATEELVVQNNNGPALRVSTAKRVVPKGANPATTGVVWTAIPPTNDLLVTLISSETNEATAPPTVTISAGQTNATFAIISLDDGIPFTSQTLSITASATNYASGSDVLTVTDNGLPDLVIASISAPGAAFTAEPLTISFRLENQGLGALTNGVTQAVYLTTDPVAGTYIGVGTSFFAGPLTPGQYADALVVIPGNTLPPPGTYWVIVAADADNNALELNKANNNAASSSPVVIAPLYSATVKAGVTNVLMGTPVPLTGSATFTAGGSAPNVAANILVTVRGLQRVMGVVTDANGNFNTVFTPLPNEAGTYTVSAVWPGITSAPPQDQFNILGMSASPASLALSVSAGGSVGASVSINDLGAAPLSGLTATINGLSANLMAGVTVSSNYLTGQGSLSLSCTVIAIDASILQSSFTIHLATTEGATLDVPVNINVNPLVPSLIATPAQLTTSMLRGAQKTVQFEIANVGGAGSGPLNVSLPAVPWMSVASANPLSSLAPGQSNAVTLLLSPATNLVLGPYSGNLAVNGTNTGIQIPFSFSAVSDAHGSLAVQSVDETTFFGAGAPPLTNATVTLTDPFSGTVVASGITDTNGMFVAPNLLEGTYALAVTANQHAPFNGSAVVTAGQTNIVQAFLSLQTVTYTWTVVPTQIQDQTTISVQTTFQTDVPAPVIVPTPASLDLSSLTGPGQFMDVPLTLANEGLIAVENVTISLKSSDLYKFDLLTTNIGSLPAHGTVTLPMRVTLLGIGAGQSSIVTAVAPKPTGSGSVGREARNATLGPCTPSVSWNWTYQCGRYGVSSGVQITVNNAQTDCMTPPPPSGGTTIVVSTGSTSGGGDGGGGGGGGGPPQTSIIAPSTSTPSSCDPCDQKRLDAIGKCAFDIVLIPVPTGVITCGIAGYKCGNGLATDCFLSPAPVGCGLSAVGCITDFIECAGKELSLWIKIPLTIISCTHDICTACDDLPGYSGLCGSTGPTSATRFKQKDGLMITDAGPIGTDRALFSTLFSEANDMQTLIAPEIYFFGSSNWFYAADTNALGVLVDSIVSDIQTNSDGAQFISTSERNTLLGLPLPSPLQPSDVNAFVDRWNLTMSNYAAGILTMGQNPPAAGTNFIDFQQWTNLLASSVQALQTYQNEGYSDPTAAWQATRDALLVEFKNGSSGGVCANITLDIDQTAILTRSAFHATLQMNNNGLAPLTNVTVDVVVQNQAGQDATSLFGIQPPTLTGGLTAVDGSGMLAPGSSGAVQWTLVPSLDAAPYAPTNYFVSGSLRYVDNGLTVTIPLLPQSIAVQPSPQLFLKYFLQRDVYGDDPFTPEIEPSIPFPLAVMVQNKGYGPAYDFHITSAQPKIVDNQKGLLINFNIIGTEVAGQPATPSLTANFGDLGPGSITIGEWFFTSSLEGLFTDYSATFQNADALGNSRLSSIQGVEIHGLTHVVRADGMWDDGKPDFLVIDTNSIAGLPNAVYLSDETVQPVSVLEVGTNDGPATLSHLQVQFTANYPAGFAYVLVPDPANGQFLIQSVRYANGTSFLTNNFWITDRTFIGQGLPPLLQTNLHLFVYHTSAGPDTYTFVYGAPPPPPVTNPPVSSVLALPTQSPLTFGVAWNGTPFPGGASIAYFDIYASDNGGPFINWRSQTTATSALYTGTNGHTYAFYSVATDTIGDREATPLQPQAQTTVVLNTNPPTITVTSNVTLTAGQFLSLSVAASDPNPQNTLTFSLGFGASAGVVVNPASGQITWATSPTFGGTTNAISIIATDNGQPPLSATGTVQVVLLRVATPPTLAPIPNYTVNEALLLTVTNSATDNNLPPRPLTFSLGAGTPTNAAIDSLTGVFQWRPTGSQSPGTNIISVIVTDNGSPPLSATQHFTVVVRAVANEVVLSLGSTNLLVGQTASVPVVLTSSLYLTNVTATLQVSATYLTNLALTSASAETTATLLQSLGSNVYAVGLTLNPAASPGGSRSVAKLNFLASPQSQSAIIPLTVSNVAALQQDGRAAAKPGGSGGRVIVVGRQPVLEAWFGTNGVRMLTLYGNPGASYEVASTTNLTDTNSLSVWRVPMTNQYQNFTADQTAPEIYYRAWEFSADPPILELKSAASSNLVLLLYGQKGSNYVIVSGTNLANSSDWVPVAGFTLTNSFEFIGSGPATNQSRFFRVKRQ
jgi:hypothetical protein